MKDMSEFGIELPKNKIKQALTIAEIGQENL